MFICGTASFGHGDENESHSISSPCPTPKRSKSSFCKISKDNSSKNPYSTRGLDKFYALLADLDDKKQKIYTQLGSDDISFVRFVYSDESNQVKPIVVKSKEKNDNSVTNPAVVVSVVQEKIKKEAIPLSTTDERIIDKEEKTSRYVGSFKLENLRHPYYYIPLILVSILLFLVVYGKSFAILCTSIGWYLIPKVNYGGGTNAGSSSTRKMKRKREFTRKVSEKHIDQGSSSPRSVINGLNYRRRF